MKRQDVVTTLNRLLPVCREGEARYEALANHATDAFRKAVFIQYWQRYLHCACEIEDKIRAHGGESTPHAFALPCISDVFLSQCLNAEEQAFHAYEQALSETLPMDIRTLLQRHILIIKETQRRTETLYKPLGERNALIPIYNPVCIPA